MPALSNRDWPENELWAWKSAPGRFVITAPSRTTFPVPVQKVVPPSSNVHELAEPENGTSITNTPFDSTIVRPFPLKLPDDHKRVPRTVRVPLLVSVGEDRGPPMLTSAQSTLLFNVTVALIGIATLSFEPGTRLGDQFVAVFQSPPAVLVQTN